MSAVCFLQWTHLGPGSRPPGGHAGHSVAGPAALGFLPAAVLAVDGAVGALVEELDTAHRADLIAQTATGLGAVLPVLRNPSAAQREKKGRQEEGERQREREKERTNICLCILIKHNMRLFSNFYKSLRESLSKS